MSATVERGFAGYGILKKISGSGAITNNTEIIIPSMEWTPRAPRNNAYPPMVNKSAFPSVVVLGKRTPSVGARTCAKTSWFTPNWLNSLIMTRDANGDTDKLAGLFNAGVSTDSRKYDGMRCAAMGIQANAGGGPVLVEMGFLANTDAGTTTFTSTPAADAGQLINAAQIDFGSSATADLVRSFRLDMLVGTGYDMFFNQTYYPSDTSSGMFGATLSLEQSPLYTVSPSTTVTIRFFTGVPGSLTLFSTFTVLLNLDEDIQDINPGPGTLIRRYSVIDVSAGGNPSTIA